MTPRRRHIIKDGNLYELIYNECSVGHKIHTFLSKFAFNILLRYIKIYSTVYNYVENSNQVADTLKVMNSYIYAGSRYLPFFKLC